MASDCDRYHKLFTGILPSLFELAFKQLNRRVFLLCAIQERQKMKL